MSSLFILSHLSSARKRMSPFFWCVVSGLIELIGGEDGVEQAREARVQIVVAYAEEVIGSHWPSVAAAHSE